MAGAAPERDDGLPAISYREQPSRQLSPDGAIAREVSPVVHRGDAEGAAVADLDPLAAANSELAGGSLATVTFEG